MFMCKNGIFISLILVLLTFFSCRTKSYVAEDTYDNFEEMVIKFIPVKREEVSQQNYTLAKSILKDTKEAVKFNKNNFVVTDYWNIAFVFALLNESKNNIELSFRKGTEKNSKAMCSYINSLSVSSQSTLEIFKQKIPEAYLKFSKSCSGGTLEKGSYIKSDYDENLKNLMMKIKTDDQKFRGTNQILKDNIDKQNLLDGCNQKAIDSLFAVHGKYIGKTLVGKELDFVMWLVVQHSDLDMMKKYLPVIHSAVKEGEINSTPLKMLIDRIYSIEFKYQFFGSQGDVEMANDSIRRKFLKLYDLKEN